jgi:hypothetical protein
MSRIDFAQHQTLNKCNEMEGLGWRLVDDLLVCRVLHKRYIIKSALQVDVFATKEWGNLTKEELMGPA